MRSALFGLRTKRAAVFGVDLKDLLQREGGDVPELMICAQRILGVISLFVHAYSVLVEDFIGEFLT
jgi:hypothetical protein